MKFASKKNLARATHGVSGRVRRKRGGQAGAGRAADRKSDGTGASHGEAGYEQPGTRPAPASNLLQAAKLFWGFYQDIAASNPGFMGKLALQDYSRMNQALQEFPAAIAAVEQAETDRAMMDLPQPGERVCVYCGCSDNRPCDEGCGWVIKHPKTLTGVCSNGNCVGQFMKEADKL